MKKMEKIIKIMFGLTALFIFLFDISYLWGTENCVNIYALIDCTLPFLVPAVLCLTGFCAAQQKYTEMSGNIKTRLPRLKSKEEKKQEKRYEKRYIVKTYARDGVHTKRINMRGNYGLLKSA